MLKLQQFVLSNIRATLMEGICVLVLTGGDFFVYVFGTVFVVVLLLADRVCVVVIVVVVVERSCLCCCCCCCMDVMFALKP